MAKLKPWYMVLEPREDLRENRPLDASEFAVHLDHVRDGRAHEVYRDPARFFGRTYLTGSLLGLCAEVVRRLSGIQVETSPVFNMVTQFGGGKTHALTALYHLATAGPEAHPWKGVRRILERAQVDRVPQARVGVFVGTELDVLRGRGGGDEPVRRTPWGELAWQLGRGDSFRVVAEHDAKGIAPAGDVLREMLPPGPTLILMDELVNYASRFRKQGHRDELYNFLQILSEEARARPNLVLCVSIPKSDLEMNPDDERDFVAFKKILDRLGKAVTMSADMETAEIVRRRLFEWEGFPDEANKVVTAYAEWVGQHRDEVSGIDAANARDAFKASYPFHPSVLSVFERKWQSLPRFQRTRGVLRLLAQWVARACQERSGEPLITLGSAPLDNQWFRAAVFEQLNEERLEVPVTTDIAGTKRDSHAQLLDREAPPEVKKARLHQKVASVIFFESNGGQSQARAEATKAELRAALGGPDMNLADIDQTLEGLEARCFYLVWERDRYRFSTAPNLNQVLVTRRSNVDVKDVDERLRKEIERLFKDGGKELERRFFPERSNDIPDRARLTLVVLGLDSPWPDPATGKRIEELFRECGHSGRSFKSALTFSVPAAGSQATLRDAARTAIAWEDIDKDSETKGRLDETQKRLLAQQLGRAKGDLRDALMRTYRHLVVLGKDAQPKEIDLGQLHVSTGALVEQIRNRLLEQDEITEGVGPTKLVKNWPMALTEWSTKAARDAFFASPALPRLLAPDSIRETIAKGVTEKTLAIARREPSGELVLVRFGVATRAEDVEIDEDVLVLRAEDARRLEEPPHVSRLQLRPERATIVLGGQVRFSVVGIDQYGKPIEVSDLAWRATGGQVVEGVFSAGEEPGTFDVEVETQGLGATAEVAVVEPGGSDGDDPGSNGALSIRWAGAVPPLKWMTFYTKVLSRFATSDGLALRVEFSVPAPVDDAQARAMAETIEAGLRDLGLDPGSLLR